MWTYSQKTGELKKDAQSFGFGYAGTGKGRNNPAMQNVSRTGPLPRGRYVIGKAYNHARLGPVCMNLEPLPANEMLGRLAFRIHGDSKDGDASLGCIVQSRAVREAINNSTDKLLEVIE